jgi:hypothetical protein
MITAALAKLDTERAVRDFLNAYFEIVAIVVCTAAAEGARRNDKCHPTFVARALAIHEKALGEHPDTAWRSITVDRPTLKNGRKFKKRATTHRTSPSLITQRSSAEPLSQSLNVYFVNTVRECVESDELLS